LNSNSERQTEIDGIRGWAAIVVLLFHLIWEIFGINYPIVRSPALYPLLDGSLAVNVFFVLSGDALSLSFTQSHRNGIAPLMVLKRYFRLAGPILFSCLTIYVLMKSGLTFNHQAAPIVHREDWLGLFLSFKPHFLDMLRFAGIGAFTTALPATSYNAFMWPMGIELVGSMIVFSLGIFYRRLRHPIAFLLSVSIALVLLKSVYALFFVGVLLGALRDAGAFAMLGRNVALNRLGSVLGLAAIYFADTFDYAHQPQSSLILASAIVFLCYASVDIRAFMRSPISSFAGKISFPMYFMQFSVITSWTSFLIVQNQLHPQNDLTSPPAIVISSIMIVMAVAYFVAQLEQMYLAWLDRAGRRLLIGPSEASAARAEAPARGDLAVQTQA
jgi:peptidoglycan/LPS O-acetylase OafA/YrhL